MKIARTAALLCLATLAAAAVVGAVAPVHPEIAVGGFPTGLALDPKTGTLYVGNGTTGSISLIDAKACSAATTRGCGRRAASVGHLADPVGIAYDRADATVYVVDSSSAKLGVLG